MQNEERRLLFHNTYICINSAIILPSQKKAPQTSFLPPNRISESWRILVFSSARPMGRSFVHHMRTGCSVIIIKILKNKKRAAAQRKWWRGRKGAPKINHAGLNGDHALIMRVLVFILFFLERF